MLKLKFLYQDKFYIKKEITIKLKHKMMFFYLIKKKKKKVFVQIYNNAEGRVSSYVFLP